MSPQIHPVDATFGTLIVVPSIDYRSIQYGDEPGTEFLEERMLFTLFLLRHEGLKVIFVGSTPTPESVVDYYLGFLPDPEAARDRLRMISLDDPSPRALTAKILERPDVVAHLEGLRRDSDTVLLPYKVTDDELRLGYAIGVPMFGPPKRALYLGTKSGSRVVARSASIATVPGRENVRSLSDITDAIETIRSEVPQADRFVVKLNEGAGGMGNAVLELHNLRAPIEDSQVTFCAPGHSWSTFARSLKEQGGVVEQFVHDGDVASPSVQIAISRDFSIHILSTHDQFLGPPFDQVFEGSRYPASEHHRLLILEASRKIARVLAAREVVGYLSLDFLIAPQHEETSPLLCEINLRMSGTMAPFFTARELTGSAHDQLFGDLQTGKTHKHYRSSDALYSQSLKGRSPDEIARDLDRAGLAYDLGSGTGVVLHMFGSASRFGRLGATCIADSAEQASALWRRLSTCEWVRHHAAA